MKNIFFTKKAQAAVEYMLLFGLVMIFVFIGIRKYLPRTNATSEAYFNRVIEGVLKENVEPKCGNGTCDDYESSATCCIDCGGCNMNMEQ